MERGDFELTEAVSRLEEENRELRAALDQTECGRAMERQHAEFSRLLATSKRIVSELDLTTVFELVADHAREIVHAEQVLVPILNEARDQYTYMAASGIDADQVRGASFGAGIGMCGWVLQHERSLLFGETTTDWMEEKTTWEEGQQSAVLVPLIGRKGIIGGLSALGKEGGGCFTHHDLDLLTLFANQVSSAIENALLFQQRAAFEEGLKRVNECFLSFGSDARENIKAITETTGEILGATFVLYNRREGDVLLTLAGWQMPPGMSPAHRGEGHLCFDLITRGDKEPVIVRNLHLTEYARSDPGIKRFGLRVYIGCPVVYDGRSIGVLCAFFRDDAEISSYQLNLLRVLGRAAAVEEERMNSEQALRLSEARFRTIIESAPIGIVAAEFATRSLRYVNPVICKMLGYSSEELLSLDINAIHPPAELEHARNAFFRREPVQTYCLRQDGSEFPVDINPIMVELDGILCQVGFFTDTTERRLLYEEQQKIQKLESIGKLAGGIAHDFNNLLQAIFGFVSMARLNLPGNDYANEMLEQAESALHQAVGLTAQLLTFSRGGQPVKKPVGLGSVIEKSVQFALSGSRAEYRLKLAEDLWAVEADEGQIGQVIQNIVMNADQAMPEGGMILITAANVFRGSASSPPGLTPGDYVCIEVQDQGSGIPEQILGRIFDPYFTTKKEGSGLGLATAYSIVRNHGGLIDVRTETDRGSTFSIFLPALVEAKFQESPLPPVASPSGRRLRVLVMDDEESLTELSKAMIGVLGHRVDVSRNGEEALELYRNALENNLPYDVVILDLTVRGGMGGVETLKKLQEIDPGVRAVVSSGYSDDATMADHLSLGFQAYLKKPYTLAELREILG